MNDTTYAHASTFERPTYQKVLLYREPRVDHELRLYLPRRMSMREVREALGSAEFLTSAFALTGPCQLEVNRSGMCICISCGPDERADIRELVDAVRFAQKLKPMKV